jgi:hypothetical protein
VTTKAEAVEPIRKIIGDLSDTNRVLVGLQVRPVGESPA